MSLVTIFCAVRVDFKKVAHHMLDLETSYVMAFICIVLSLGSMSHFSKLQCRHVDLKGQEPHRALHREDRMFT